MLECHQPLNVKILKIHKIYTNWEKIKPFLFLDYGIIYAENLNRTTKIRTIRTKIYT